MENTKVVITKLGDRNGLAVVKEPLDSPGPNQVTIKVETSGVAFADIMIREGLYTGVSKKGVTPGYDALGRIVALGSQVKGFKEGDRVAALTHYGGNAYFVNIDTELVCPCPEGIPAEDAVALILNYTTAYQLLTRVGRVHSGENVLVHGAAGGVGSALTQLGLHLGANIYGTLSKRKWDLLDEVLPKDAAFEKIDYQAAPFEEGLKKVLPKGPDVVFDPIGGKHWKRSYTSMNEMGRLVACGFAATIKNGRRSIVGTLRAILASRFSVVDMLRDNKGVMGYGIWAAVSADPQSFREDMAVLFALYQQGAVKPLIGKVLPITEVIEAHRLMETSQVAGKIVLAMAED